MQYTTALQEHCLSKMPIFDGHMDQLGRIESSSEYDYRDALLTEDALECVDCTTADAVGCSLPLPIWPFLERISL